MLTNRERSELLALATSPNPLWGGIFRSGGDVIVDRWEAAGLIKRTNKPYVAGRAVYENGYVITKFGLEVLAGRAALKEHGDE